jgi:hypothetical protein
VKVFADEPLTEAAFAEGSALHNETYSFQVAYCSHRLRKGVQVTVESAFGDALTIRSVGLVPSELPVYSDHDEHVLRSTPGLYPDSLLPIDSDGLVAYPRQWRSVWVTIALHEGLPAGEQRIVVRFTSAEGEPLAEESFTLRVIPALLPEQQLLHTEWFHTDCIATYYGLEVFSEQHWTLIERFIQTAVRHGMNMILTPLFTPPLDTAVGGERPTVQLVDVTKTEAGWQFGFDRLKRWTDMCERNGVRCLELSHLFTQWGAKHAPKIVANVNGRTERVFGWDTDASGEAYKGFLDAFLPALLDWLDENGWKDRCYFHTSDEPSVDHMESYEKASAILKRWLDGYPMIDALSDYSFYEKGLVKQPIPANNHIEPFLEHDVKPLWTYYCCSQYRNVANRFFCMPSARNRILGIQLYKFDIAGFLHWGYNFWYSQYSRKPIDPYKVTDAGGAFPSGDAFLVYPGPEGPIESIRLKVMQEALQDLRALELLGSLIGKEALLQELEEGIEPITWSGYPRDAAWLLQMRGKVNRMIAERVG